MLCLVCGLPILPSETPIPVEKINGHAIQGNAHEFCADPEDVMAAGAYDPSEDYPHGSI